MVRFLLYEQNTRQFYQYKQQLMKTAAISQTKTQQPPSKSISGLVNPDKMYPLLNIFELEVSRLFKISIFEELVNELKQFNTEIEEWKKDRHDIKNIVTTYHLYENLSSRLKYLTNFSRNQSDSFKGSEQIARWFFTEKPKIRCLVKQPKASIPPHISDQVQSQKIDDMVQYNQLKRQMQPYEMMARTVHPGMIPPKQQLKDFKRKTFLPFQQPKQKNEQAFTVRKSTSGILNKNRLNKFRQSVGTMMTSSTMNETKSSFKKTVTQFKTLEINQQNKEDPIIEHQDSNVPIQQQNENQEEINKDQQIVNLEKERQAMQQKMVDKNLIKNLGPDDEPDDDVIFNDDEDEEPDKTLKLFINDHNKQEIEYAEQVSKQAKQSTLRKIMKLNEDKIRSKLQDLDFQRNMSNWGKIKGKNATQYSKKLESNLHLNRYKEIAHKRYEILTTVEEKQFEKHQKKFFNATTGFKGFKHKQQINQGKATVVPVVYRSKSSHPVTIESEIKKLRIQQCMKTYARYINHVPSLQVVEDPEDKEKEENNNSGIQVELNKKRDTQSTFRSTSLTSLASHTVKKKPMSTLLRDNNPTNYNEIAQQQLIKMKGALSGKLIPVEKGTLYNGLSIIEGEQTVPQLGMYKAGKDLPSNPFFPKFPAKKKKKKSKK